VRAPVVRTAKGGNATWLLEQTAPTASLVGARIFAFFPVLYSLLSTTGRSLAPKRQRRDGPKRGRPSCYSIRCYSVIYSVLGATVYGR